MTQKVAGPGVGAGAGAAPGRGRQPVRRLEFDWLRAIIVLGLIPFHTAVIFNVSTTLFIKDAQRSYTMDAIGAFTLAWGMPLLFLISGAAAYFALGRRGAATFLRERTLRLLVPFVFATVAIVPVSIYVVLCSNPRLLESFAGETLAPGTLDSYLTFYPRYLAAYLAFFGHYSMTMAMIFFGHLWFFPRLILCTLICLPFFLWLRGRSGRAARERLGGLWVLPGGVYLLGVPFGVSELLLRAGALDRLTRGWPVYDVWAELAMYLLYFALGYVLYSEPLLLAAVRRYTAASFALGVVALVLLLALNLTGRTPAPGASLLYAAYMFLRAYAALSWVLAVLGLAMRLLTRDAPLLRYLNEAVLPLYVLHLPVLTIVAFFVVRWPVAAPLKFATIAVATLAFTLAVYELGIRHLPPVRMLFGMKARPGGDERRAQGPEDGGRGRRNRRRGDPSLLGSRDGSEAFRDPSVSMPSHHAHVGYRPGVDRASESWDRSSAALTDVASDAGDEGVPGRRYGDDRAGPPGRPQQARPPE